MPEAKYINTEALSAYTEALSKKLSRVYDAKGSAIYADTAYLASASIASPSIDSVGLWQQVNGNWTKITEVKPGWVYDITNKFTTDSNFIDGGNVTVAKNNNIVVVNTGTDQNPVLKFDLLAMGIDLADINETITNIQDALATKANASDVPDVTGKQDKELSTEPTIIIPDHTVANTTARTALTTATVADGDIAFQEDTEEYYYAEVESSTIAWHDIGNTKTVEGAIKLIGSVMPIKPISTAEIQAMFA
jgi:hypothetical protein